MAFDPDDMACPYCGYQGLGVEDIFPDEHQGDSAYVATFWNCHGCGRHGRMTIRMEYVHAVLSDEDDEFREVM